jgi:hypothetical protein
LFEAQVKAGEAQRQQEQQQEAFASFFHQPNLFPQEALPGTGACLHLHFCLIRFPPFISACDGHAPWQPDANAVRW